MNLDNILPEKEHTFRHVSAPYSTEIVNNFISVSLRDDEKIEWTYGTFNGKTYITGYVINKISVDKE